MIAALAAGLLSPFFFQAVPEVRSTYISIGKIADDRPMQTMFARVGVDAGDFGRFGIRNWDVSSLTSRLRDVRRLPLWMTEFGPTWQYDLKFSEDWRLASDLTRSWTLCRGYVNDRYNATYHWWHLDQYLHNPYVVPFWSVRRGIRNSNYFYFKSGLLRRFPFLKDFYVTPSAFAEGGSSQNQRRVFGRRAGDKAWYDGVASVSFRVELGWRISENFTGYAYVEQYEVVGGEARRTNADSPSRTAHNDWTYGGIGLRMMF